MKYCEKCNSLSDFEYCSVCGNKNIREVASEDYCFLTKCEQLFGDILNDALQQEGVICALVPCGDGVRSQFALLLDKYKIYVPFQYYKKSVEVLNFLSYSPTTDELKEDLLANIDKWHIDSSFTVRKIPKKLKLSKDDDVFKCIKVAVEKSQCIEIKD